MLDGIKPRSEPVLLRRVIMNTIPKFEKKIDSRTEGCDRALASALGPARPC